MQEYEVDCVVAGAGAVGLAIARALARAGRDVMVVEAAQRIGTGISARNSEVIHAGIYYPAGSLKAELCVWGKALLYQFAAEAGVDHRRCGKFIVATGADQGADLDRIAAHAAGNGVTDLERISGAAARALEPNLNCTEALVSPSSGIIDAQGYMNALRGDAESHGANFAFKTQVARGEVGGGITLVCEGDEPCVLKAQSFINCAGLDAPALARSIDGFPTALVPQSYWAKGNYFALSGRSPFSRLVYPVPEPGGLGVHLTLDLAGQARFGPDVEWVDAPNYDVDPARGDKFYAAIRRYWPGLRDGALTPAYAGIRPKISPPGAPDEDFRILGPDDHGVDGVVHLFGIESPGLTSSLAIAERVANMLAR